MGGGCAEEGGDGGFVVSWQMGDGEKDLVLFALTPRSITEMIEPW